MELRVDPLTERARMEEWYRCRLSARGVEVGWGRNKQTGEYYSEYARDAWAAWQAARATDW